jgi:hypothetical protein
MIIAAIASNLWRAAAQALAGIVLALLVQVHGLPMIGGGLKADLAAERTAHLETQRRYALAQVEAAEKARAYRLSEEARYRALATKTDTEHASNLETALAAARRHADNHRCAPVGLRAEGAPDVGATSGSGTGAEGDRTESGDRSSGAAQLAVGGLVAVTEDDLRICTVNTTRLQAVREWAAGLSE